MNIIQYNNTNVNILGKLSPVDEDRALQGCNLSAYAGPPFGDSLPVFMYPYITLWDFLVPSVSGGIPVLFYPYLEGGNECAKPYHVNLDGDPLESETLDVLSDSLFPEIFPESVPPPDFSPPVPPPVLDPGMVRYKNDRDAEYEADRKKLREACRALADVLSKAGREDEADRVRSCGDDFISFEAADCKDTVARPMSCGHRLCPICMRRVSAEYAKKVEQFIWYMKYPKHWTFTFVNVVHVDKEYFQKVGKCIKDLIHRKVFVDNVAGGFFKVETTAGSFAMGEACQGCTCSLDSHVSGGSVSSCLETCKQVGICDNCPSKVKTFHVHIHSVLDAFFIPIKELKEAWRQITKIVMGDEAFEIRYRIIDKSGKLAGNDNESVEDAIREISKYVVKPENFLEDPEFVNEYLDAVAGQRLMTTFGNCYQSILFRVPLSCSSYLDMGNIPLELAQAFKAKKITLLSSVRVITKKQGKYWIIVNGRDEYRIKDNCNKDEDKRKLNVSRKVLDDDESEFPDCFCGCNKWIRQEGKVSADRVYRDIKGYYRLKPISVFKEYRLNTIILDG